MPEADSGTRPPERTTPDVVLHGRYIKDLSFENPGAPHTLINGADPHVDVSVEIGGEQRRAFHEVVLSLTVTATLDDTILFLVELKYAGLFEMHHLEGEPRARFIFIEAPRMLFPFVDRIIADVVRDGGLKPFHLTPPDFMALYQHASVTSGETSDG